VDIPGAFPLPEHENKANEDGCDAQKSLGQKRQGPVFKSNRMGALRQRDDSEQVIRLQQVGFPAVNIGIPPFGIGVGQNYTLRLK
jgi:hypothetical protein